MKSGLSELGKKVRSLPFHERTGYLKDYAKGERVYIVTPGPSLTTLDQKELNDALQGSVVLACKQAYNYVAESTDIHLMSCYSYQPYEYFSEDTLVHWQLTAMSANSEFDRISTEWKHQMDFAVPIYSAPWISLEKSVAYTRNFNNWKNYENHKLIWGPGIMYESGFPLALHLGAKEIVTVGWDIGDLSKFKPRHGYKLGDDWHDEHATDLYKIKADGGPDYTELKHTVESTAEMYDWLTAQGVTLKILSDRNPADKRIPRIKLKDL